MTSLAKTFLAAAALLALPAAASAQDRLQSPVPDRGGGGPGWAGCITATVHGQYRLSLCDNGRYRVTGGGLNCNGFYRTSARGPQVQYDLSRSQCGRGTAWTGDTIVCSSGGPRPFRRPPYPPQLFSPVPDHGGGGFPTNCWYYTTPEAKRFGYHDHRVSFR